MRCATCSACRMQLASGAAPCRSMDCECSAMDWSASHCLTIFASSRSFGGGVHTKFSDPQAAHKRGSSRSQMLCRSSECQIVKRITRKLDMVSLQRCSTVQTRLQCRCCCSKTVGKLQLHTIIIVCVPADRSLSPSSAQPLWHAQQRQYWLSNGVLAKCGTERCGPTRCRRRSHPRRLLQVRCP